MPNRTRTQSHDANQFAASIVAQISDPLPVDLNDADTVSRLMREMGRRGGIKGAASLNSSLTAKQRSKSARNAAKARWAKKAK